MIKSNCRGHVIYFNGTQWLYEDDNSSIKFERPCARCGKMPNGDGSDCCLGYISGVKSACCGHGVEKGYVIYK